MNWTDLVNSILTPAGIVVVIFQSGRIFQKIKTLEVRMDKFEIRMNTFETQLKELLTDVIKIKERLKK